MEGGGGRVPRLHLPRRAIPMRLATSTVTQRPFLVRKWEKGKEKLLELRAQARS